MRGDQELAHGKTGHGARAMAGVNTERSNRPLKDFLCGMSKKSVPKSKPKSGNPNAGATPPGMQAMRDLQKLLSKQNFNSIEEAEAFMKGVQRDGIPGFVPQTIEEEAEALVEQAMGKTMKEAVKQARRALELDPNCIPAYELLAQGEELIPIRAALFKRGVDIGIDRFGGEYMEQNQGHFWGLTETRPYMRCLFGYAESLFDMGQIANALNIWMEMLELNPNDNIGVRQQALLALAALGEEEDFAELDARYADDSMCGTLYNRALMEFNRETRDRTKADALLKSAIKRNPHVPAMLLADDEPEDLAGMYSLGSAEEAENYARYAWAVWQAVPEALEWLTETQQPKLFKV